MIRALIFDFDGTIIDTETPDYITWQEVFASYGCDLSFDVWGQMIGSNDDFDWIDYLESLTGYSIPQRQAVQAARIQRITDLVSLEPLRPGVMRFIAEAEAQSLSLGIASSSDHPWVFGHLQQRNLASRFACIKTREDVVRTKPDPALYLEACDCLQVKPHEAIAIEDSPNGAMAARRAGLFTMVVPNQITLKLAFPETDLILQSLDDVTLVQVLTLANGQRQP